MRERAVVVTARSSLPGISAGARRCAPPRGARTPEAHEAESARHGLSGARPVIARVCRPRADPGKRGRRLDLGDPARRCGRPRTDPATRARRCSKHRSPDRGASAASPGAPIPDVDHHGPGEVLAVGAQPSERHRVVAVRQRGEAPGAGTSPRATHCPPPWDPTGPVPRRPDAAILDDPERRPALRQRCARRSTVPGCWS